MGNFAKNVSSGYNKKYDIYRSGYYNRPFAL
jgi:hypothetical protein